MIIKHKKEKASQHPANTVIKIRVSLEPNRRAENMASFNGKADWIKAQALFCLYKYQREGNSKGLSISEWTDLSGVRYKYLNSRISQFWRWGYICRDTKVYKGKPVFDYKLGVEGHKWLKRWVLTVPGRVKEIEGRLPKLNDIKALFM